MMFEAPQTERSLAGEVLSPPIVQLSSLRTHSTGLWAYFHNPLQKPPGYTPLSISPAQNSSTPCQLPPCFSPLAPCLTFSLQSHNIPRLVLRLPRRSPPFPSSASPIVYFSSPFPEKERGLARAVKRPDASKQTVWELQAKNVKNYSR